MSPTAAKYGAIGSSDEEEQHQQRSDFEKVEGAEERGPSDYEMGQTYYLKPTKSKKALLRGLVPIIIALLILGGAGYYFFEDVLNPGAGHHGSGKGGEVETTNEVVKSSTTKHIAKEKGEGVVEDAPAAPEEKTKGSSSSSSGSCSSYPKCVATGLTGMCCPAAGGIMLECCK